MHGTACDRTRSAFCGPRFSLLSGSHKSRVVGETPTRNWFRVLVCVSCESAEVRQSRSSSASGPRFKRLAQCLSERRPDESGNYGMRLGIFRKRQVVWHAWSWNGVSVRHSTGVESDSPNQGVGLGDM